MTRDTRSFLAKVKEEWETAISKMFSFEESKLFYKDLKMFTRYSAHKRGQLVDKILNQGEIIEDPRTISQLVVSEVLLNRPDVPNVKVSLPEFTKNNFAFSSFFMHSNKAMGPDAIPGKIFAARYLTKVKDKIIEDLEEDPETINEHLQSSLVMLNK